MDKLKRLKILGIDPGTARTGYAVIESARGKLELLESGTIGKKEAGAAARLLFISRALLKIISRHAPQIAAVEKLFFSKNVRTAMAVAEARGAILLTLKMADITVYEYSPQEIKIALTSSGNAPKPQVAAMTRVLLGISKLPRWDDESDAIAIAITGIVSRK